MRKVSDYILYSVLYMRVNSVSGWNEDKFALLLIGQLGVGHFVMQRPLLRTGLKIFCNLYVIFAKADKLTNTVQYNADLI
jgi:hypothetical protein